VKKKCTANTVPQLTVGQKDHHRSPSILLGNTPGRRPDACRDRLTVSLLFWDGPSGVTGGHTLQDNYSNPGAMARVRHPRPAFAGIIAPTLGLCNAPLSAAYPTGMRISNQLPRNYW